MLRKRFLGLVVVVLLLLSFLPCYSAEKVVVDKWKIPFITVLTGAIAHAGLEIQWAT